MHDMIDLENEEIINADKKNNSQEVFYFFIEKVFETITDEEVLKDLLSYIQDNYKKFPKHIKNKVLLYSKLYQYHKSSC